MAEITAPSGITTYSYSGLGLKAGVDILLWRMAARPDDLQEATARLLGTGLGRYLTIGLTFFGLIRPSTYVRRQDSQEQSVFSHQRSRYLVIYPFTKTTDWYLMSREARQGMMNEHMRVGHEFPTVRQGLVYSFGLDDAEFVVSYETDHLDDFQSLVMALRETEARRYTLRDTPIITCIHRPLVEMLSLLG